MFSFFLKPDEVVLDLTFPSISDPILLLLKFCVFLIVISVPLRYSLSSQFSLLISAIFTAYRSCSLNY